MVPELPRQHISASNATGYQVQLATSYFWTGVPQGSILGPLLFLAYIDDIPQCIQHHSKIAIFADDSKLYQIISKPSDKILFQQDLTQLSNWSHTWAMSLSIPKCKTLIISRKKSRPSREYHLDGTLLTTVSETIDLGITITDNLQWSQHIKQISLRANRTLAVLALFAESVEISVTLTPGNFYTVQLFDPS